MLVWAETEGEIGVEVVLCDQTDLTEKCLQLKIGQLARRQVLVKLHIQEQNLLLIDLIH